MLPGYSASKWIFAAEALSTTSPILQDIVSEKTSESFQKLSDGFVNPPMTSRPGTYWCWLNGDVTNASLTSDLEEMKEKGIGRAEIWDVELRDDPTGIFGSGPEFLGDESVEFIH
jgi:hypothetical protein